MATDPDITLKVNVEIMGLSAQDSLNFLGSISDDLMREAMDKRSLALNTGRTPKFLVLNPSSYLVMDINLRMRAGGSESHLATVAGMTVVVDRDAKAPLRVVCEAWEEALNK